MSTAVLDLYVARGRVRGEVALGNFSRVSDLMNSGLSAFLGGRVLSSAGDEPPEALDGWPHPGAEFAMPLSAILLLVPVVEPVRTVVPPGVLREREHFTVDLEVEDWQVHGTLHLLDRIRWADFLASAQGKFVPASHAVVGHGGAPTMTAVDFLLINGSRISALYAPS